MPQSDEPSAILMLVNEQRTFINNNNHMFVVVHKTASGGTAQDIARFFANDPAMASTHYVIGQDGTLVQCVLEKDGAGGNCCEKGAFADFLPIGQNLNTWSVSIEHVDPASDNSTPLTDAQKAVSFKLIHDICQRHNIPMRRAANDGQGGIIGHNDIDPVDRARCPGNYPWAELWAYLTPQTTTEGTTWVSTSQEAQAAATWASTTTGAVIAYGNVLATVGIFPAGQMPYYNTGIALSWQEQYMNGHNYGPPTSYEYNAVAGVPLTNWDGKPMSQQNFSGGRCEWWDGQPHWFQWA